MDREVELKILKFLPKLLLKRGICWFRWSVGLVFPDRVVLCSRDCPGTQSVDQAVRPGRPGDPFTSVARYLVTL